MEQSFLRSTYLDTWQEYRYVLKHPAAPRFDFVVLTASDEWQAECYRMQIEERKKFLAPGTRWLVLADPQGKRIGSGGATLRALHKLSEAGAASFQQMRGLIIHSGGDSKRLPQYSALGKLFAWTGHRLPDGRESTVFDELIITLSSLPARMGDGILTLSGDVLFLFNALQCDLQQRDGAVALTMWADGAYGERHGVFLADDAGNAGCCMQKLPLDELRAQGAVDANNKLLIDTGAIWFSGALLDRMKALDFDCPHSLYVDWLYPMTSHATEKAFFSLNADQPCQELGELRRRLWETLSAERLGLQVLSPAEFLHIGSTKEYHGLLATPWEGRAEDDPRLNFWDRGSCVQGVLNSFCAHPLPKGVLLEDSVLSEGTSLLPGAVVSGIDLALPVPYPDVVLHALPLQGGKYVVRVYGRKDNPKEALLFGKPFCALSKAQSLWEARIFPISDTPEGALRQALGLLEIVLGTPSPEQLDAWNKAEKCSMHSSYITADVDAILKRRNRLCAWRRLQSLEARVRNGVPAAMLFEDFPDGLADEEVEALLKRAEESPFPDAYRLYWAGAALCRDSNTAARIEDSAFAWLRNYSLRGVGAGQTSFTPCHSIAQVMLPARVNLGGGWSDTPPYCYEHGGTVLSAAVCLDGAPPPLCATVEIIKEQGFQFESQDQRSAITLSPGVGLGEYGNPADPFALHKGVLKVCGLEKAGGLRLATNSLLPKGSGLGGSSILGAALVKALLLLQGKTPDAEEVAARVLELEQWMTTGGGWQDQLGGLIPGFKLLRSGPGVPQQVEARPLSLSAETTQALEERLVLVYSGQRRLAKNLLRSVMGGVMAQDAACLDLLHEIQRIAVLMAFELERGDLRRFAELMNLHWDCSKRLDPASSNRGIEFIMDTLDDLIAGRMICGAGGGGYLQLLLREGVPHEEVRQRLHGVFSSFGPRLSTLRFDAASCFKEFVR